MCRAHPHLMLPLTTSATNREQADRQKEGPFFPYITLLFLPLIQPAKVTQKRKPFDV